MRPELRKKLRVNWLKSKVGYEDHVNSIIAMKLTPAERRELCAMFDETRDEDLHYIWAGVMYTQPDRIYRATLVKALDSPDREKARHAVMALLAGNYEGALEEIFRRDELLRELEEDLPVLLGSHQGKMTEAMERKLLKLFWEGYAEKSTDDFRAAPLLLSLLHITRDETAATLLRLWDEAEDKQAKGKAMMAMLCAPHVLYAPVFRKLAKSRDKDLREVAEDALDDLDL